MPKGKTGEIKQSVRGRAQSTVVFDSDETVEKINQLAANTGLSANRVMNALLDYAVKHAKVGRVVVAVKDGIVFDDDEAVHV